jgi:hypothetical protein
MKVKSHDEYKNINSCLCVQNTLKKFIYIYIHIYILIYIYIWLLIYTQNHMQYVNICAYMYACINIYLHIYAYLCKKLEREQC